MQIPIPCTWMPSPSKNNTGLQFSRSVFPPSSFPRTQKARYEWSFNEKRSEWSLLHLITTTSLSVDESAVLDSIADNSGELEDSLQLAFFLLKLTGKDHMWRSQGLQLKSREGGNLEKKCSYTQPILWCYPHISTARIHLCPYPTG